MFLLYRTSEAIKTGTICIKDYGNCSISFGGLNRFSQNSANGP